MPSAPTITSAQSRKAVRAFSFNGPLEAANDEKENFDRPRYGGLQKKSPARSQPPAAAGPDEHPPQTPASRIPLADLIGNTEDAWKCPLPVSTPLDYVRWESRLSSSEATGSQHQTQRGKKRARSSSPGSSQADKRSLYSASKDIIDLETAQKSTKTPQNDPAADLWSRYTSGVKLDTKNPSLFAHLSPSSPQTPESNGSKDSALRRTASCGVAWPTSKSKKRRTETKASYDRTRGVFAAAKQQILAPELPKQSRVGLLVEKIQETLSRRDHDDVEEPSSSSPLPDRGRASQILPAILEHEQDEQDQEGSHNDIPTPTRMAAPQLLPPNEPASSDYGDDEIDLNLVESFERASTQDKAAPESNDDPLTAASNLDKQQEHMRDCDESFRIHQGDQAPAQLHAQSSKTQSVDTFSDDDFTGMEDVTMDELQCLVDEVDSQLQARPEKPVEENETSIDAVDPSANPHTLMRSDDSFDDDDDLWQNIDENTLLQQGLTSNTTIEKQIDNRAIKRYLIVDIVDSHYSNTQGRKRPEKMLSVKDEKTKTLRIILLRQSWYETRCTKGSYVHLVGDFDRSGQCIVDDAHNMIVLHPDHLISATVIADSFTCVRRAALQDRVKATSAAGKPQVYGHILHAIFGEALTNNTFDTQQLREIVEKALPNYLESLYEINVSIPEATAYVMDKMPELQGWASVFVSSKPVPDAVIRDRNGGTSWMGLNRVLAVEEHIWSPMYGLKGNIDATVQVAMKSPMQDGSAVLTVPFELKTGKKDTNEAHRAQTALYTLLMSDRYDINVTSGVLYYLETSKTFRIEGVRNEIRHMVIQRNELACYVHEKLDLPPMIRKSHLCKYCYAQTACFAYHKFVEDGTGETSGLNDNFEEAVSHLKPQHQQFFRKWDHLLTLEERDTTKFRRELWTMLSHERESLGRCFANVVIEPGSACEDTQTSKINRFQYSFIKHKQTPGFSFTESQLTTGEPIVISDEKGHFALANGYVTNVRPTRITVAVDRQLLDRRKAASFDPKTNQVFIGDDLALPAGATPVQARSLTGDKTATQFRIDKDEFSNGMATARNNLIRIMEKDLFRARELRQLIIDDSPPTFKDSSTAYILSGPASQQDLNIDQRRAIDKVMSAKDYALVLGMPGTGKTTTIAHIIRALVSQNKSVLLTSYTHTAVDNILLKIKDDHIPILRLGSVARVHPEVKAFADLGGIPTNTLAELEDRYTKSKVVATTCLGINEKVFNARVFDYCIVDEASQITLPVCLGPIRMAKTFILVGDHYQLPPLVQNKEAAEGGLDVSLFRMLSEAHPEAVVNLEHQYRMAEDVMCLANELVYDGRLKCGTRGVAERRLAVPNLVDGLDVFHRRRQDGLSTGQVCPGPEPQAGSTSAITTTSATAHISSQCWFHTILHPHSPRVLFLDTDALGPLARETISGSGHRITNTLESTLLAQLSTVMIRCGVPARSIGIITFYRSQLALLKRDVKALAGSAVVGGSSGSRNNGGGDGELEMHTADKFQGRDKEVILLSYVRSNEANNVGELLKDWRRVNVAVTRAKSKLVIVGSLGTLRNSGNETLRGMVGIVERRGWVVKVREDWMGSHDLGYASGSGSGSGSVGLGIGVGGVFEESAVDHNTDQQVATAAVAADPRTDAETSTRRDVLGEMTGNVGRSYENHTTPSHKQFSPLKPPVPRPTTTFRKPDKVVNGTRSPVRADGAGNGSVATSVPVKRVIATTVGDQENQQPQQFEEDFSWLDGLDGSQGLLDI